MILGRAMAQAVSRWPLTAEACDCSDQAAHYHNLGPKLGASLLTRHIGWKQKQKVKKNKLYGATSDVTMATSLCVQQ
jgi:hypothetical protein